MSALVLLRAPPNRAGEEHSGVQAALKLPGRFLQRVKFREAAPPALDRCGKGRKTAIALLRSGVRSPLGSQATAFPGSGDAVGCTRKAFVASIRRAEDC